MFGNLVSWHLARLCGFLGTMPISLHYIAFLGYDYAVSGHKTTFLGARPLLSITNAIYGPNAVSGLKAIFLALQMLFMDPMPFLGYKPFS